MKDAFCKQRERIHQLNPCVLVSLEEEASGLWRHPDEVISGLKSGSTTREKEEKNHRPMEYQEGLTWRPGLSF